MDSFRNRQRQAALRAQREAREVELAGQIAELRRVKFTYESLCAVAASRGWVVAVSVEPRVKPDIDFALGLHLFNGPVARENTPKGKRDWRLIPHGRLMGYVEVEALDFDEAAVVLYAEILDRNASGPR